MGAKGTTEFATSIMALVMLALTPLAPAGESPCSGGHNATGKAESPYLVLI